jgi:hypothetical protein
MNLRFVATLAGCMLAGAAGAVYYRADGRPVAWLTAASPFTATLAEAALPPLFMRAAAATPLGDAWPPPWPPRAAVAFHEEMLALRNVTAPRPANTRLAALGAAPQVPTAPQIPTAPQLPPPRDSGAGAGNPPLHGTDWVVIRDRFGRPLRVERRDPRAANPGVADPRAYPPPNTPYGPYGPYRR